MLQTFIPRRAGVCPPIRQGRQRIATSHYVDKVANPLTAQQIRSINFVAGAETKEQCPNVRTMAAKRIQYL